MKLPRLRPAVLASARTSTGEELAGGRDALLAPGREIRWEQVLTADWDSEARTLTLVLDPLEVLAFELEEPARLLQLVRERVTASVVLTRRVPVDAERGFTVMARRPPGGGEIRFTFEYDRGLDPDEPAVTEAARQALREVRDDLGL